jgi:tight adherence protein C
MPAYVVVAALAVTLSIPMFVYSMIVTRVPGRQIAHNLRAGLAGGGDLRALVLSQSPRERILGPVFGSLGRRVRRLSPSGVVTALERRTELAGVAWPVERLLLLKLGLAGGLLAADAVWVLLAGSTTAVFFGFLLAGAGYLGPDVVLLRMARARQLTIANQLPDVLDQLTICVEAGLGFDSAMARTAGTGTGPLAQEIARLLQDLRVGVPRVEALDTLLARTDVPDLRQFVHAISQAETYGVPVSRVLRSQASEQREKRRFRAEERAMKLPVKVIFPLVFCILPVLFIVVIGPAFIKISGGL